MSFLMIEWTRSLFSTIFSTWRSYFGGFSLRFALHYVVQLHRHFCHQHHQLGQKKPQFCSFRNFLLILKDVRSTVFSLQYRLSSK